MPLIINILVNFFMVVKGHLCSFQINKSETFCEINLKNDSIKVLFCCLDAMNLCFTISVMCFSDTLNNFLLLRLLVFDSLLQVSFKIIGASISGMSIDPKSVRFLTCLSC